MMINIFYINNNIIGRRFASGFDNTVHALAEWMTGASPKQQKQVTSIVGNVSMLIITIIMFCFRNMIHPFRTSLI